MVPVRDGLYKFGLPKEFKGDWVLFENVYVRVMRKIKVPWGDPTTVLSSLRRGLG